MGLLIEKERNTARRENSLIRARDATVHNCRSGIENTGLLRKGDISGESLTITRGDCLSPVKAKVNMELNKPEIKGFRRYARI